jgi:hypothetical protein
MPHKYNADPSPSDSEDSLQGDELARLRGWASPARLADDLVHGRAIAAWRAAPQTTPGGQARYSDLAIETSLILRAVFHQPLRQTEGLVGSLLGLMGLSLPVPDHSTLSRGSMANCGSWDLVEGIGDR